MSIPKKGETFVATVRDLASDGRGILSHPSGLTVFVPGVWRGEECRVRFIGLQNRIGLGELVELIHASEKRIAARCPHHGFKQGDCGGCPWQFMDYDEQLAVKQGKVDQAFARFEFFAVKSIWPSNTPFGFRNRAQLKSDGATLGYVSAHSNELAPIQECPILTPPNQQTLKQLLAQLPNDNWRPLPGPRKQRLQWTSLNIDDSLDADQVLVNKRLPFQQSHHQQNERMRGWLAQQLRNLNKSGPVLELFCGTGNFTGVIAACVDAPIVAVDGEERALQTLNGKNLANVTAMVADLFNDNAFDRISRHRKDFSILVLDPPRDGLKHIDRLLNLCANIETVFYISCNLATLTRDLEYCCRRGLVIQEVQPLDQTPHSPHMELLVKLGSL